MKKNKFTAQVSQDLKDENFIGFKINHKVLNKLGFFVIKKAFKKNTIDEYKFKFINPC